jgi:phage gp29-like protein
MRRVVELFELGQRGDMAYLQWTYGFIERRNPTLSGLLSRCEAPLTSFDWSVKVKSMLPPGGTKDMADAQQKVLTDAYSNIDNLREALVHLHSADFRGYAHLQKHRDETGAIYHLEPLNQWCICRDGLEGNWFWNPDSRSTSQPMQFLGKDYCIGSANL